MLDSGQYACSVTRPADDGLNSGQTSAWARTHMTRCNTGPMQRERS